MPAACNICQTGLQERLDAGDARGLRSDGDPNCASCGSRPRMRTLRLVAIEHVRHRIAAPADRLTAVQLGGSAITRRVLAEDFGQVLDGEWEGRTPRLPAIGPVQLVAGILLTADQEPAALIRAAADALEAGGLLLVHVDGQRLEALGPTSVLEQMEAAGLQAALLRYVDPFSGLPTPWLLGRRVLGDEAPPPATS